MPDRFELSAFYDFRPERWKHIPHDHRIESTCGMVRLRQEWTKGSGSRVSRLAMDLKLAQGGGRALASGPL